MKRKSFFLSLVGFIMFGLIINKTEKCPECNSNNYFSKKEVSAANFKKGTFNHTWFEDYFWENNKWVIGRDLKGELIWGSFPNIIKACTECGFILIKDRRIQRILGEQIFVRAGDKFFVAKESPLDQHKTTAKKIVKG